ncbi:MAG TPA: RtcB family protein, partial [Saprospiraceae bacterium]|nr:RtcB family protein [Saprospiraceae bacterium]
MKKLKLTGKYMRALGYPEGPVISIAMNIIAKEFKKAKDGEIEFILLSILQNPEAYIDHRVLGKIAVKLLPPISKEIQLKDKGIEFAIFGKEHIEQGAIHQMHIASKLPIAQKGALMPDAHSGYGLPIGGVLATKNTVIPYGVGVDIGCRMSLSILDISLDYFEKNKDIFISELNKSTLFGSGAEFQRSSDHPILGNDTFNQVQILKNLHGKAWKQLGSSGSGNHFVEFGEVQINVQDEVLLVPPGRYLGLLSHSGSRGLGTSIAQHYTKIAKDQCQLPGEAKNLAWLDLGSDDGLEYWLAMNLAGDYASACHEVIHKKIIASLRCQEIEKV